MYKTAAPPQHQLKEDEVEIKVDLKEKEEESLFISKLGEERWCKLKAIREKRDNMQKTVIKNNLNQHKKGTISFI